MKLLPLIFIAFILTSCNANESEAMINLQNAINDSIPTPSQDNDSICNSSTGVNFSVEDFGTEEDTVNVVYP